MDGWIDGWMDGSMDGWMDRWMDRWMDGWIDGWMDGSMDRWMDGCPFFRQRQNTKTFRHFYYASRFKQNNLYCRLKQYKQ